MAIDLYRWLGAVLDHERLWEASYGPFEPHPSLELDDDHFAPSFADLSRRLEENYPFFHPRYAGQMLKPPHAAAVVGYVAAMLVNPNNHALDGGPATAEMERAVVDRLADMFGFGPRLGHLTSSGTIANLEALFVARESHPGRGVAYSSEAHYTHGRMCHLLGMEGHEVGTDDRGRIDLGQVEALVREGRVGTVVLSAGTTGLGAVDRVDEALALKESHGVRIHVDAAYGGFFAILGRDAAESARLSIDPRPWLAIPACDSVVVDPHKHGLQPYGCGAVLFSDPRVARHYLHDSPYTYYTAEGSRHLGEISLECSRAGAAAAALWLTLELFPLTAGGLGRVLAATRRAALAFERLLDTSDVLELYQQPDLDIVVYFPASSERGVPTSSAIDRASSVIFEAAMSERADPFFLSLLRVTAGEMGRRHRRLSDDVPTLRLLRSVLMKPEAEDFVPRLTARLEELCGVMLGG